ncbi:MAG: hypothetical protein QXG00_04125 [Candidatus Woesearchaeota archaeon]
MISNILLSLMMIVSNPDTAIVNTDTTSIILLKFDEPLNEESVLNIRNYSIKDSIDNYNYKIYRVGIPKNKPDEVVLVTERLKYKRTAVINVVGVKDTANNVIQSGTIYYYHRGLKESLGKPVVR